MAASRVPSWRRSAGGSKTGGGSPPHGSDWASPAFSSVVDSAAYSSCRTPKTFVAMVALLRERLGFLVDQLKPQGLEPDVALFRWVHAQRQGRRLPGGGVARREHHIAGVRRVSADDVAHVLKLFRAVQRGEHGIGHADQHDLVPLERRRVQVGWLLAAAARS